MTAAPVKDAKTVHTVADGRALFCMCIGVNTGCLEFNNRAALRDGRIVPRRLNSLGSPELPLGEIAALAKEFDMGWQLKGPRTAQWCMNYLTIEGLGLEQHHERFRQICRLDAGSRAVQEHFQLSVMLRNLLQVDGINGCNSMGIELMFRRLQTREYSHSEKAREAESRSRLAGGKLALEEQYVFGSVVGRAGTLMISPALLSRVKEETEREVLLAKNLRKAREERERASKTKKKPNKEENPYSISLIEHSAAFRRGPTGGRMRIGPEFDSAERSVPRSIFLCLLLCHGPG